MLERLLLQRSYEDVFELNEQFVTIVKLQGDVAGQANLVFAMSFVIENAFAVEVGYRQAIEAREYLRALATNSKVVPIGGYPRALLWRLLAFDVGVL